MSLWSSPYAKLSTTTQRFCATRRPFPIFVALLCFVILIVRNCRPKEGNLTIRFDRRVTVGYLYRTESVFRWIFLSNILATHDLTIIVITPTHQRRERLADMTRLSNTLSLVRNLHWIVVEDGNRTNHYVDQILRRSKLPYYYTHAPPHPMLPRSGWNQRNHALSYIRQHYSNYSQGAVVYFADDDNVYDLRLFDRYIRRVQRIGIWAVGLVGSSMVEAPKVLNGKIVGWNAVYFPQRYFATDMAGFAVNLNEILRVNASFNVRCRWNVPETCFLTQFKVFRDKVEPFGHDDYPKEILVWHTKTRSYVYRGKHDGYLVEDNV